jgi:hypothetical protein
MPEVWKNFQIQERGLLLENIFGFFFGKAVDFGRSCAKIVGKEGRP